ncbi:HAD family hydrolase [Streptomyces sp. NPDC052043]|uniref:HAD family hydrolase n=1 Tax=Streptomyces sp. NPDC052043 TaxID=3365684 RepID=UPI0037D80390
MTISAVLFDVDGVLLDSAAAHRKVWNSWSQARGLDAETVWRLTFGRRPEDTVRDAATHLDPVVERMVLDDLLARERDDILPVDGAAELLEELADNPWAIVTSGDRAFVEHRFAATGLPLPAVRVYGDDVELAKPAPDCFTLAASRLGVAIGACLVVEDAPAGIHAALAAGCTVIGLTTTHPEEALSQAHMCATSLAEVRSLLITQGFLTRSRGQRDNTP